MTALLRSRRWLLWGALLALVVALLVVLVFLAAEYEQQRDQTSLEADATGVVSDIRSGLLRNVQTLQSLHSVASSADAWDGPAAEMLASHREIVRLEWRDLQLRLVRRAARARLGRSDQVMERPHAGEADGRDIGRGGADQRRVAYGLRGGAAAG